VKRCLVAIGLVAAVTAAPSGQTPKYGVEVKAEKNVDFAKLTSYSWVRGRPSIDKNIDTQIVASVDRELAALGLRKNPSGAGDVLATYSSMTRTDVDVHAKPDASGSRPQYTVGSLLFELLEHGTRRRLLQLKIDQPIKADPATVETAISDAVTALFAKYPTRGR
jgi:hypothetical protein